MVLMGNGYRYFNYPLIDRMGTSIISEFYLNMFEKIK